MLIRNYLKEILFFALIPAVSIAQAIFAKELDQLFFLELFAFGVLPGLLLRTVFMMRRKGSKSILRARLSGEMLYGFFQGIWVTMLIPSGTSLYAIIPFLILLFAFADVLERPDRPYYSSGLVTLILVFALMISAGRRAVDCGSGNCSILIEYPWGVLLTIVAALVLDPSGRGLPAIIGGLILGVAVYLFGPNISQLATVGIAGIILFLPGRPIWSYKAWILYTFILILSLSFFYGFGNDFSGSRVDESFFYRLNVVIGVLLAEVAVHTLVFFTGLYRTVGEQRI